MLPEELPHPAKRNKKRVSKSAAAQAALSAVVHRSASLDEDGEEEEGDGEAPSAVPMADWYGPWQLRPWRPAPAKDGKVGGGTGCPPCLGVPASCPAAACLLLPALLRRWPS